MAKPIIVDLFSGCGGFGLGAELAGFHCHVAIDIDTTLQSAYRLNFPKTNTLQADISNISKSKWNEWLGNKRPDGIIGGPPCQGFSRMGSRDRQDPRNSLVGHYFRTISELQPKFFVMENVEGILDSGNKEVLFDAQEYVTADYTILEPMAVTASHYGAPTTRKRVIVIGYKADEVNVLSKSDFIPEYPIQSNTVEDAIKDLPSPIQRLEKAGFVWAPYKSTGESHSSYAKECRKLPSGSLGNLVALKNLKKNTTSGHELTIHSKVVADRYTALKYGQVDKVSKAKRLAWDGLCPTLRAGTGREKGSHQAVRPIHPEEGRVITVREAARLQGFPDWFMFHPTKWHSFRMIGNSVSPKVSRYLLSQILKSM